MVLRSRSVSDVLRNLGLRPTGGNHRFITARIRAEGVDASHFRRSTLAKRVAEIEADALVEAVQSARSVAEVLERFQLPVAGRGHREMIRRIAALGIDARHLKGRGWARGETRRTHATIDRIARRNTRPDEAVFVVRSPEQCGPRLVKRLLALGWQYECRECRIAEWQGRPLVLHLDHINGVHDDNRLENLRLLCPNCHSLTDTFCNRRR